MKIRTGKQTINYLDDYLFMALLKWMCDFQVQVFLDLCNEVNFPVSLDKTFLEYHMSDISGFAHRYHKTNCCNTR